MKSEEYKRGYDAGYKQALLDALDQQGARNRKISGPDSPFKPRGMPGSIYNLSRS